MKNYFHRYILRVFALILFSGMASSLFAISFNEPRKVIIPQYANAVYRGLTVMDKMYLDVSEGDKRYFLLEIGKRPTYFWNPDKSFHLQQEQTLELDKISYYSGDWNRNKFTIANMNLQNGSFASEGLFLGTSVGSSITINNNSSNLLVNYVGNFLATLTFGSDTFKYNFYSLLLTYSLGSSVISKQFHVDHLYLRDVIISGVIFPSPRMMVYYLGGYKANGTATAFELSNPGRRNPVKNYYGPWELHNEGKLTTTSGNPCVEEPENLPYICKKNLPLLGDITDKLDEEFVCLGRPYSSTPGYDHGPEQYGNDRDWCYDYQEETVLLNRPYNDNGSFYEFKVEEVHKIVNGQSTLIPETQMPKTRKALTTTGDKAVAFTKSTNGGGTWSVNQQSNTSFFINGEWLNAQLTSLDDVNDEHPCFTICNGYICKNNYVYIRNFTTRELKSADTSAVSMWPSAEGPVQDLYILTYTIGFCPNRSNATNTNYEINYRADQIEVLAIKSGASWVTPKVCMRRKVKCNSLTNSGESGYSRSYTLLSTDR